MFQNPPSGWAALTAFKEYSLLRNFQVSGGMATTRSAVESGLKPRRLQYSTDLLRRRLCRPGLLTHLTSDDSVLVNNPNALPVLRFTMFVAPNGIESF
jgi:hypothetical protein